MTTPRTCQFAVIGGGPAGLAAATLAARLGVDTVLLDEQPTPGGQAYRNIEAVSRSSGRLLKNLGKHYGHGNALVEAFRQSGVRYEPSSSVWQVTPNGKIGVSQSGQAYLLKADRVLIATGAVERPVAVPGWTLPGVMTAGAVQTLMKAAGIVPDEDTVLAGSGPLIYLVALQLLSAGAPLRVILQTQKPTSWFSTIRLLSRVRAGAGDLLDGLKWIRAIRSSGVPIYHASDIRAEGRDRLEAVTFQSRGRRHRMDASALLLHEGVIPNIQLTASLRCAHRWDEAQVAWAPVLDQWGTTSHEGIAIAGDGAGTRGAKAAPHSGRLAALETAFRLGRLSMKERDLMAAGDMQALARQVGLRTLLDHLYSPSEAIRTPADADIVCRCEEVSAGEIRQLVDGQRFVELDQLKSQSRCGMGQCQGRMCGQTIALILAEYSGVPMKDVGYFRLRIPVKPLPLDQLAHLQNAEYDPEQSASSGDPSQRV
ncbi:NAD(P)/FAD-dependent oxidoreductase [Mesorhizobium sp. LjNodule214]|uniref:FAD/NAD(P)-dependent oxidoreductase n=1 Tax=Mesorhizobium sp. LjNodule214 TaxID=3342252 RepID=UPI003ECFF44B